MEAIWAQDLNGVIGKNGSLPWHIPRDLRFFKTMTLSKTLVMGRATFDGMNQRLLPQRKSIILTRQTDYQVQGAVVLHSLSEVLDYKAQHPAEDLVVIGGAHTFQLFLPYCDVIYRTVIEAVYEGDVHMLSLPADFHLAWQKFEPVSELNHESLIFEKWVR